MALTFTRATYSQSALHECADKIKSASWTVKQKREHVEKCYGEVKQIFLFCFEKTGCLLFDTEYSPWKDYSRLLCNNEVYKSHTKKEMDAALRQCYLFLAREINGILTMVRTGEVDCIA